MAGHFISGVAPGVGLEAGARLSEALAHAGRQVSARQRFEPGAPLPVHAPGTLRWRVLRARARGGTVLVLDEHGPERWDLVFFRALSAVADGVVVGLEQYDLLTKRGLCGFFAGRTLEVALELGGLTSTTLGSPPLHELLQGRPLVDVYGERLGDLCGTLPHRLHTAEVLAVEDWKVSTPVRDFELEVLPRESLLLLPDVEAQAWQAVVDAGRVPRCRWRAGRTPIYDAPYVEVRHAGGFEEARVLELSRELACPASAVELTSAGTPFRWVEANRGELEDSGTGATGDALLKVLMRAVFQLGEGAGLIFGRGNEGWNESPG